MKSEMDRMLLQKRKGFELDRKLDTPKIYFLNLKSQ